MCIRDRLQPAAFQRAVTVAQYFDPDTALDAGFFDELVYANELSERANQKANEFRELDDVAHRISKRRIRAALVRRLRRSVPLDLFDAMMVGLRRRRQN